MSYEFYVRKISLFRYLLKPDLLRRADRHFDPFTECMIENTIAAYVAVEVCYIEDLSRLSEFEVVWKGRLHPAQKLNMCRLY